MNKSDAIVIDATPHAIYRFAAATERWPELLPHYRAVRIVSGNQLQRVVEMSAWRGRIPIRWVAEQINDPELPRIRFRHLAGPTKGMEVEWIFTPCGPGATEVRIDHRLAVRLPFGEWLADRVIGNYFIRHVAGKTLACMKRLAEGTS